MNFKALTIIELILIVFLLIGIWQAINFGRILKQLKQGKENQPDSHYFELKYQLQFIQFAGITIITILGILGYATINDVREDVTSELTERIDVKIQNLVDSVNVDISNQIQSRIELTDKTINNSIATIYSDIERDLEEISSKTLVEVDRMLSDRVINTLKRNYEEYSEKIASGKRMVVIDDLRFQYQDNAVNVISFANLNVEDLTSIPTFFISPKNSFDYQILKVSKEDFTMKISNPKQDSIAFSILFFLDDK